MRALVVLTIMLAAASSAQAGWFDNMVTSISSLFATYEEAPYNVVATYPGYEERVYPARKWVCTRQVRHQDDDAEMGSLFYRLFRYITGQNAREENIDMTVPVSTEFTVGPSTNTYQMCFYIGQEHQADPAEPTDSQVMIEDRPEITVYTRTVGGYMPNKEDWLQEANRLAEIIKESGKTVDLEHMYWVGYDAPHKFWNRRNEIWFLKN